MKKDICLAKLDITSPLSGHHDLPFVNVPFLSIKLTRQYAGGFWLSHSSSLPLSLSLTLFPDFTFRLQGRQTAG